MAERRIRMGWQFGVMLTLLLALAWPAPHAARSAPGSSAFGINSHIASRHAQPGRMATPASLLAQAGTGWAREDLQFHRIAPAPGRYEWRYADAAIDALAGRGINVIGLLNGPTPGWAAQGRAGDTFAPPDPAAFASFAAAAVARYRDRVRVWEIWNEPDNALYWQPAPDIGQYATLLKTTSAAIRAVDPTAQIMVAGIVSPEPAASWLAALADQGAWSSFDIVSIHPYTDPLPPERGQIDSAGFGSIRSLVDRLGRKPIWATESGYSTGAGGRGGVAFSEEDQASYLVRSMVLLRAAGAEKVLWYSLKDAAGGQDYGVFRGGNPLDFGSPRPSFAAFTTLNQYVGGSASLGALSPAQPQTIADFERFGAWRRGDQPYGTFTQSGAQVRSGAAAGQLTYGIPEDAAQKFVVFTTSGQPALAPGTSQLGIWVYGDGGGSAIKVWLRGAGGEVLQYRLGYVGGAGWQFLSSAITGPVESYNRISGTASTLSFPATLAAIVLDNSEARVRSGTIFLDDITALAGPEAYGARFDRGGGEVIDVYWSIAPGQITVASASPQGALIDRQGGTVTVDAAGGRFTLSVGPSPLYLIHRPASPAPAPAPAPAPDPGTSNQRCFSETGQCIGGRIREFWEQNGGLPVFGFPTSPQRAETIEGATLQVQWFERTRLELHPANPRPYDVLLGRVGDDLLRLQGRDWRTFAVAAPGGDCLTFSQTGHSICGRLLQAWRASGLEIDGRPGKTVEENLALFGLPLSSPQSEVLSDGRSRTVQWFERARLELHPENAAPYDVLLGLLGNETRPR